MYDTTSKDYVSGDIKLISFPLRSVLRSFLNALGDFTEGVAKSLCMEIHRFQWGDVVVLVDCLLDYACFV